MQCKCRFGNTEGPVDAQPRCVAPERWPRFLIPLAIKSDWYDTTNRQVRLTTEGNPALRHRSIELALRRNIVDQGSLSHVVYEGLGLRYGAAHGFGSSSTRGIVIRDCDIAGIGGGHQFTTRNCWWQSGEVAHAVSGPLPGLS